MTIEQTSDQRARVEEFQRKHRIVLLTLLFTDVVGSTRLKQLLGERAALDLTVRHHALLREMLLRFPDAEEIDSAGDSFFMVFAKPSDAVQFALLAQRGLRELARETGQPVFDRIGIHVGEVFVQDRGSERRNLFGIQVDSTARIRSLGKADQILLSRFAFDNARLVLRGLEFPGLGELSWLNHGYYEIKGVEEPLEVCEVGEAGLAALTPPGDSEIAHRFHAADAEPVLGWRPAAGQLVPQTRWKLERPLGQGGFGEVWLAQHETLKQRRVLKFCFKAERARALKREATLFRVLRERFGEHPNIVAIHDVFFNAPPFYLVMDFVDGPSLDRWTGAHATLAETPLEQRLELVAQIADALQAAHDSGIIHRDVKPSNVLIADPTGAAPRAKLVDFGIGKIVNAEALAGVTRLGFTQTMLYTGSGTGTPLYQAPELLRGDPASPASDVYSLCVVLFQVIAGDFKRSVTADWEKAIEDPLLGADIARGLSSDPKERFASAADLAVNLRSLMERRKQAELRAADERERMKRSNFRRKMRRGGEMVVALCLLLFALWSMLREDGAVEIATEPAGAEVWENGKKLGTTPFTQRPVKPGRREYVIRAEGYEELTYIRSLKSREVLSVMLPLTTIKREASIAFAGPGILEKQGTVEVADGKGRWIPLDVGKFALEYGDRVRTREKSRVSIRFSDLSVLRMEELTTLEFSPPKEKSGKSSIEVKQGGVYFLSREKSKELEIRTPIATAALRG
ncbi:MAG: hypothetical protein QOE70_2775 [Chthoniobacter sp.]|jgi:serine/threonine-protein kinase|nr:hypothetical protein [Chthoniobacter sp.]